MPEIKTKLNSYALTDFIGHELDGTERFTFLIEAKPGKVTEDLETGDTEQTVKIVGLWDCADDEATVAMMRRLRTKYKQADDDANGRKALGSYTEQPLLYTDSSGVVMTTDEIAEARGERWSDSDEFRVVFDGGQVGFWPDDFPGQTLAAPGGMMALPNDLSERGRVARYVDPETAETIAEWSDEDRAAEEVLIAEREAAADAEAVAVLEAGRTPQIDGRPVSALKAGEVVAYVKASSDHTWLAQLLGWERGQKKPRRSVMNAVVAALTATGVETESLVEEPAG